MAYVHFRNVKGKVPHYHETIDEGDIDMLKVLNNIKENNYTGVLIPTIRHKCHVMRHGTQVWLMRWDICKHYLKY
ncbi:hypothetical protein AB6H26_12910 [Providencia hangzhouensis]|uniref:hypothetical protein n=1 Tax=Providencia hangzhouensis TaxID=3031799 RepID=UPI0034DCDADC